jgi:hypothetical protein
MGLKVIVTWHYRAINTEAGKRELERVRTELEAVRRSGLGVHSARATVHYT